MKQIIALLLSFFALSAYSQVAGGTLEEVTVRGNRTVQKNGEVWIVPTETERRHSNNAYSLLGKLSLDGIRIDQSAHTLTATDNRGAVSVRINDVPATVQDMLSLDVSAVVRIEYADRPGLRNGEDVAYSINIVVKRPASGYTVGTDMTHDISRRGFSDNLFGRANKGKSEWGVDYSADYEDQRGSRTDENARYVLADGTVKSITRHDLKGRNRSLGNTARLSYSIADSCQVLQMRMTYSGDLLPDKIYKEREVRDSEAAITRRDDSSRSHSPSLDVYFHRDFSRHQQLTASATATHISTTESNYYDEGMPYSYDVKGRVWSLKSEILYENRLKPFTLTAGMQYNQKLTDNEYSGDALSVSLFRSSEQYLFSQIAGTQFSRLQYTVGLGGSRRYYRQGANRHDFFVLRPRLRLTMTLCKGLRVSYDYQRSMRTSQIALVNDVAIRVNSMEMLVGNPALKPTALTEHTVQANYNRGGLSAQMQGYVRLNHRPNMHRYIRTDDNLFIDTQENQPHCNMYLGNAYVRYDLIPDRLNATVVGTFAHFDNKGNDYRHRFSSVEGTMMVNVYLGKWSLTAYADTGWRWMEGERRGKNGVEVQLVASYQTGNCSVSLYCRNPFRAHPMVYESLLMNENLQKKTVLRDKDQGNYLGVNFTFRLSHGRKYREINRTIMLEDKDAGILK